MKQRNSAAAAQAPPAGKQSKKSPVQQAKKHVKTLQNIDDILTAEDHEIIRRMEARLKELYYLNDEQDFIGYC